MLDPVYKLETPGKAENSVLKLPRYSIPLMRLHLNTISFFSGFIIIPKALKPTKKPMNVVRVPALGVDTQTSLSTSCSSRTFCFIVQITQRNFPAVEKFVIEFDLIRLLFVCRPDLSPEEPKVSEQKITGRPVKLQIQIETSLAVVRAMDDSGGVSSTQWQEFAMIPLSSFHKIKKILLSIKQVYKSPTDDQFHLTPQYKTQCKPRLNQQSRLRLKIFLDTRRGSI